MLRFFAEPYLILSRHIGRMQQHTAQFRNSPQIDQVIEDEDRVGRLSFIETVRKDCQSIGFVSALDQLQRMQINVAESCTHREWNQMQLDLANRIDDEFSHKLIFWIPREKEKYYLQKGDLFGESVIIAFHSARGDVEESGKCYATGRNTACVFHLMRVIERGLRTLATTLNEPKLDPRRNPTWEAILGRCDEELRLPVKDRTDKWRSNNQFFSDATANLRAVKDAWRNPTIHVEQDYDEEKALDVLNAVGAFMRHLSTELKE